MVQPSKGTYYIVNAQADRAGKQFSVAFTATGATLTVKEGQTANQVWAITDNPSNPKTQVISYPTNGEVVTGGANGPAAQNIQGPAWIINGDAGDNNEYTNVTIQDYTSTYTWAIATPDDNQDVLLSTADDATYKTWTLTPAGPSD